MSSDRIVIQQVKVAYLKWCNSPVGEASHSMISMLLHM